MQVTNITVGYDRKRQPAQYESAGARVEFSASLSATVSDTEDHVAIAVKLLGEAKTIVLTELGIVKAGESASAMTRNSSEPATSAPALKTEPVMKAGAAAATRAAAKTTKAAEPKPAANDIPGNDSGSAAPTTVQTTASADAADIPDEPATATGAQSSAAAETVTAGLTAEDVHALVHGFLKDGKIDKPTVKKISREKFGVERIADIKPERLPEYKAALEAAVAAFTGAADI
jgi:hypothetical protein